MTYHGSAYADFQTDAWEASNIDTSQIAAGPRRRTRSRRAAVNQLQRFRDVTADLGGYVKKNVAWWYGAYRDTEIRAALSVAARHCGQR